MGAESSLLKSCELGEPLDVNTQDWSIHPGRRSDGSKVTVFVNKNKEEEDEEHIKNATRVNTCNLEIKIYTNLL